MSAKTMAEVLAAHWSASTHTDRKPFVDKCDGCGAVIFSWGDPTVADGSAHLAAHQATALTAAGFGLVADAGAKRGAAAAGVRSILDIWGSVGRSVVRMGELRESETNILTGEWDKHIDWNLADIAKERARAAAVRGEG